jgi:hypothetical protein
MQPQTKDQISKYTLIAKKIIYDANRMKSFLKMMDSQEGALQAVQTVMGAIEKHKPIPPQVYPYLGVNVYMLMVDIAQEVTGNKPDPAIIQQVIGNILKFAQQASKPAQPAQPQPAPAPAAPQGMLAQGA